MEQRLVSGSMIFVLLGGAVGCTSPAERVGVTSAAPSAAGSAGAPRPGAVLAGPLPANGPERAPVWTLPGGPAEAAAVHRLALALGIIAPPVRAGGGWHAAARGVLEVSGEPGQRWTFHAGTGPDRPASPGTDVTAIAQRFARTAGIATGPFHETFGGTVVADIATAGSPVAGWQTQVTVAGGGRIVNGGGWLARPVRGAALPVITAQQAFDALKRALATRPGPLKARCPQIEQEACPPGNRSPVTVTGARFGLSFTYFGNRPMLAPSWLFTTAQGAVIPQVALAPEHLTPQRP